EAAADALERARKPRQQGFSVDHAAASDVDSSAGSAYAHCVMLPAPRKTTKSPGRARLRTIAGMSLGPEITRASRCPTARIAVTRASAFAPSIGSSPAG